MVRSVVYDPHLSRSASRIHPLNEFGLTCISHHAGFKFFNILHFKICDTFMRTCDLKKLKINNVAIQKLCQKKKT